jgi:hypothetical protein
VFQHEIRLELSTLGIDDAICYLRSTLKYIYYILLVTRGDAVIDDQVYHSHTLSTSAHYARYNSVRNFQLELAMYPCLSEMWQCKQQNSLAPSEDSVNGDQNSTVQWNLLPAIILRSLAPQQQGHHP